MIVSCPVQASLGQGKYLRAGRRTVFSCDDNGGPVVAVAIHACLGLDECAQRVGAVVTRG